MVLRPIQSEVELHEALDLCYRLLGNEDHELYCRSAWLERFRNGHHPLVCAFSGGRIISAVLGRAENDESLILGCAACHEDFRRRGITRRLVALFEAMAKDMGYRTITLGSREDAFYEACGYRLLQKMHGQSIYQKTLDA